MHNQTKHLHKYFLKTSVLVVMQDVHPFSTSLALMDPVFNGFIFLHGIIRYAIVRQ